MPTQGITDWATLSECTVAKNEKKRNIRADEFWKSLLGCHLSPNAERIGNTTEVALEIRTPPQQLFVPNNAETRRGRC